MRSLFALLTVSSPCLAADPPQSPSLTYGMARQLSDAENKLLVTVVSKRGCAACEKLKQELAGAKELERCVFIVTEDPAIAKALDVTVYPNVFISEPRTGRVLRESRGPIATAVILAVLRELVLPAAKTLFERFLERLDRRRAAVKVRRTIAPLTEAQGSGSLIRHGGKCCVLTNAHVAELPGQYMVEVGGRPVPATWVAASTVCDLALLQLEGDFLCVAVAEAEPAEGAALKSYAFGSGQLRERVGKALGFGRDPRYGSSARISTMASINGDSGSGVLNSDGELVGVTWGYYGWDMKYSHVPLSEIRKFLNEVQP